MLTFLLLHYEALTTTPCWHQGYLNAEFGKNSSFGPAYRFNSQAKKTKTFSWWQNVLHRFQESLFSFSDNFRKLHVLLVSLWFPYQQIFMYLKNAFVQELYSFGKFFTRFMLHVSTITTQILWNHVPDSWLTLIPINQSFFF